MANFTNSFKSGHRLEVDVRATLERYSRYVYTNVDVPTLHTEKGYTEIDILAWVGNVFLVVESKNVAAITGDIKENTAIFNSFSGSQYHSLSPLTQNRIHQFSLSDRYSKRYGVWPNILPCVVVPSNCVVNGTISEDPSIIRFQDLASEVDALAKVKPQDREAGIKLAVLIEEWKGMKLRG